MTQKEMRDEGIERDSSEIEDPPSFDNHHLQMRDLRRRHNFDWQRNGFE